MRFFTLIITLLLTANVVKANYVFDKNCLYAYEASFALRFKEAHTHINNAKKSMPDNGIIILVENYLEFIEAVISESDQKMDSFLRSYPERINRLNRLDKNSPWHNYIYSEMLFQATSIHLMKKEYMRAGLLAARGYRLLERNRKRYPAFSPNLKMLGLINIAVGSIPDEYKWITKAINLQGNVKEGLTQLTVLLNHSLQRQDARFLRNEALFLLSLCEYQFGKDHNVLQRLLGIYNSSYFFEQQKINPLLTFMYSKIFVRLGDNDKAISLVEKRAFAAGTNEFYILDYYTGLYKLNRLDNDANNHFNNFVNNSPGKTFKKSAWQKLAWISLLNGDTTSYLKYISVVANAGNRNTEGDRQANREAYSGEMPETVLLKARLLFDGGYYSRAVALLDTINPDKHFNRFETRVEFYYRLARIYQESGRTNEAEELFLRVIRTGRDLPHFYAANSALQLGYIYEEAGNREKAIDHYKQCLDIRPEEYRIGIHQKAKAGINRLM